ncbi:DUF397 domain-containing protein [Actinokineospora inagensis]|uniref:DUF397 domain-containing protein n=1 Tax=Actinokineospora inagensis TaxID=103730 RepID=UPI00047CEB0A|nr:DUF397 domain-containing protein [Actinokineospora inagensis]
MIPASPTSAWRKSSFSSATGSCVEVAWRKSSFSTATGSCVEVAWRKSSFSTATGDCVEVGPTPHAMLIRDTKNPDAGSLTIPHTAWPAFVSRVAS